MGQPEYAIYQLRRGKPVYKSAVSRRVDIINEGRDSQASGVPADRLLSQKSGFDLLSPSKIRDLHGILAKKTFLPIFPLTIFSSLIYSGQVQGGAARKLVCFLPGFPSYIKAAVWWCKVRKHGLT